MADLKNRVQKLEQDVKAKNIEGMLKNRSSNIYEALSVISRRARQLNIEFKKELHQKLDEFAMSTEIIEETMENKEQEEISKFYERLPNPVLIASHEFINDELKFTYRDRENESKDQLED